MGILEALLSGDRWVCCRLLEELFPPPILRSIAGDARGGWKCPPHQEKMPLWLPSVLLKKIAFSPLTNRMCCGKLFPVDELSLSRLWRSRLAWSRAHDWKSCNG